MLGIMEERKTSVLTVLTDISAAKSLSDGDPARSFNELRDSPQPSFEELRTIHQSKKLLQKKNQLHPLFANHPYRCASMYAARAASSKPNQKLKDISQRIVSAKLLQIKELRNQLTLIQHQLNEVTNENRFLKTLQKRQEVALRKYEGHEARLPQLIQQHNEEVRMLTAKMKQLKHTNQRLMEKLKTAEHQLSTLQEQHCHLVELSRNNRLGEREELANRVEELEATVSQHNNTIQLLNRKVDLERKNYKHELGMEKSRRSEVERKLALAMQTIENLKDQIEAKEKCMNAIVPSRYVRTSQGAVSNAAATAAKMTQSHYQIPRTPRNQNGLSTLKNTANHNQAPRRSSTDNTGDETDVTDSRNGLNTSESSRTISNTTLPKIKPQMSSRNMRNQYKLSSKRLANKETTTNGTPEYSSSFASEDNSLRKNSESGSDKQPASKSQSTLNSRRNSSRSRKFSVDSGVMNRSESGKITQRTNDSRASSSKTRRNSISVCPTTMEDPEDIEQYLRQDSLAAKIESHKNIREELRELEEKLLQGSKFLEKSKKSSLEQEVDTSVREMSKGLNGPQRNVTEDVSGDEGQFGSLNWNEIHDKMKAESEAAEAKLEEYYNTLEKSELGFEETENYIALEEEQKSRLLKALHDIDREAQGVSSGSSEDEALPSSNQQLVRRKSDGYRYSFSKSIDNLHKGRPVYDNVKVPAIEKMKREEKEYMSGMESERKNKTELMKELFGNYDDKNESFAAKKRHSEDLERLVELDRAID